MTQCSFIKSAGGFLVPYTDDTKEYVDTRVKLGAIMTAEFKLDRNPAFHRKYFALLKLGLDYWQPTGGAISPFERKFLDQYINHVAKYVGHEDVLRHIESEYLQSIGEKRAANLSMDKDLDVFRHWVIVEAGYYDLIERPDGSVIKKPHSISFASMDDTEFNKIYKASLNVIWTFILNTKFKSEEEVDQVICQLMEYAA